MSDTDDENAVNVRLNERSFRLTGWRADVIAGLVMLLVLAVVIGFGALMLWALGFQVVRP